jgi:L-methionine (R)-S-oxide reductase
MEAPPWRFAYVRDSRSEICLPVYDRAGGLIAVFDVDSTELNSFDAVDEAFLSRIIRQHFS